MKTNPNDKAFASPASVYADGSIDYPQEGLTKREYFAAMAMQGLLSDGDTFEHNVHFAVKVADLLIEQLNKEHNEN